MTRFSMFSLAGCVATLVAAGVGASAALMVGGVAVAQDKPQAIATFRDWSVFVREIDGDRICFAGTEAKDKSPKSVRHGGVFFLIASWKSGAATHQPSLMTGYNLSEAPRPSIRVGSDRWEMYVSDNEGFIERADDERKLVNAMRRGANMQVSAVSGRGTATAYTISLQGVTKALERAEKACR